MAAGPAFTFVSGNAAKVAALPLYAVGEALAAVVPRSPRRWVVGSGFGVADGALAVARGVRQGDPSVAVVWLASSAEEVRAARAAGLAAERKGSARGLWATLRAGVVVITHGFGDVSRYGTSGAVVVQLWHGSPLKRLHLDSPAALRLPVIGGWAPARRLMAAMYRRGTSRISLLPAGSETAAGDLARAFGLPARAVPVTGEPRTDVLFAGDEAARRRDALARLEATTGPLGGRRVVLHAPTWRDGGRDPAVPTAEEWAAVEAWCERTGSVLVVRPHRLGVGEDAHVSDRVRLLDPVLEPEVIPVLWACDVLVSDYSSTLVDFAVTGRPVVFLAPDVEEYVRTRGLYRSYEEISGGHVERTWAQVLERIDAVTTPGPAARQAREHSGGLAAAYHRFSDGRSTERVLGRVGELTGLAALAALTGAASADAGAASAGPVPGPAGQREAVFFESFYGRNASCNPRAIDAEISRRRLGVERVWAVDHDGVEVPAGARAVVVGTQEWRRARDRARLLVVNDWVRDSWRPRRGQFLLQTWHGTPLKRIALGRRDRTLRQAAAVVKQSSRWSAMLAQSPAAARMLRRSYAVARPMWTLGYPRNDVVARGEPGPAAARLGVSTRRVVLYAPTWRDGRLGAADPLDAGALADGLGPEWTVVVRGHARTMAERVRVAGERVVDATDYPDAADLLALADVLVTDYSSVMFDFSASGRPMVFFVPDLEEYRDEVRGFYLDLASRAPGPLVRTTTECVAAVAGSQASAERFAQRYAAWRAEFNPFDDGGAARRVVDRLVERGVL